MNKIFFLIKLFKLIKMKKYNLKKYRSIFSFIIILLFFITILSTACATDPDKRMDPGVGQHTQIYEKTDQIHNRLDNNDNVEELPDIKQIRENKADKKVKTTDTINTNSEQKLETSGNETNSVDTKTLNSTKDIKKASYTVSSYNELYNTIEDIKNNPDADYEEIINLNDGDYNITRLITWGNSDKTRILTINGNNHIISGGYNNRFIRINNGYTLNLENITVKDCMTDVGIITASQGAVMYNDGTVNIRNSNFTGNTAYVGWLFGGGGNGGVAYNTGHMTITNSTFKDNSASNNGGVIYNTGNLDIQNSSFEENIARTSGGVIASSGNVVIQNSNFTANSITGSQNGGGANSNSGNFTIYDSNFTANNAVNGGANYNLNGNMNIYNSNFTNNSATQGGANTNRNGTIEIKDSIFKQNSAVNGGANSNCNGTFYISNSTFIANTATQNGAIIYNDDKLDIAKLTLNDNYDVNGASIYTTQNISMTNTVVNNTFETYVYDNTDFISPLIATNLPADEDVIFTVDGKSIVVNKNTTNSIIKVIYNFTSSGIKRVNVVYPTSSNNAVIIFDVKRRDINITLNPVDDIKTLENVNIIGTIKTSTGEDVHGVIPITIKINDKVYSTTNIVDGKINIAVVMNSYPQGRYKITIEAPQSSAYNGANSSVEFNIVNRNATVNITTNTPNATKILNVNVTVKDSDNNLVKNGVITIKLDGNIITTVNLANGMIHLYFQLPMKYVYGSYPLSCEFSSPYYNSAKADVNVDVKRNNIVDPVIPDITTKTLTNITISKILKDEAADQLVGRINAKIYIDDVYIKDVVVNNGNLNVDLKTDTLDEGNYTIRYVLGENGYYNTKTFTSKLVVINHIVNITLTTNTPKTLQTLQVDAIIIREDKTLINSGVVVFKINNIEVGRSNVTGGYAHLNYKLPPEIIAEDYMIVAQFSAQYYENQSQWREFSVIRSNIKEDTLPERTIKTQNNLQINEQLTDEHGENLIGLTQIKVYINDTYIRDIAVNNGELNRIIPTDTLHGGVYNIRYEVAQSGLYNAKTINQKLVIENKTAIITIDTNTPKTMDILEINTTILNLDNTPINTGEAVFKINGDSINETIIATVVVNNSNIKLNYTLPANMKEGRYTLSVEFRNEYYNTKIESKSVDVLPRGIRNITLDTTEIKTLQNMTINTQLYDEYGQTLIGENSVDVLINNIKVFNTTISGGVLNITVATDTLLSGQYNITLLIHKNGIYDKLVVDSKLNITNRDVDIIVMPNNPYVMDSLDVNITLNDTKDGRIINDGYVIFKINGCTLKDDTNKTIKVIPTDSMAQLNYILPSHIGGGKYVLTVIYTNKYYNQMRVNSSFNIYKRSIADINIDTIEIKTKENTTLNIQLNDMMGKKLVGNMKVAIKLNSKTLIHTTAVDGIINTTLNTDTLKSGNYTITVKVGENSLYNMGSYDVNLIVKDRDVNIKISTTNTTTTTSILPITAKITDINGVNIDDGVVIFKINNKTLKDVSGNEICANVSGGLAYVMYRLPESIGCGNYTITAAYRNSGYIQTDATKVVEILRSNVAKLTTTLINTPKNHNTTLKMRIYDVNGGVIKGSIKCAIKINNKTVENTIVVDGLVNIQLNTENLKVGNYMITVKTGENSLYNLMQSDIQLKIN